MLKIKIICVILLIFNYLANASSLRNSVQKVLSTNPDVIAERKNQDAFKTYVDERKGKYLPTLDIVGYLEESKATLKPNERNQTKSEKKGYSTSIVFQQLLYDGGLTPSQVEQVRHESLGNQYRSFNAIEDTVLQTSKMYTSLVQSDEILALTSDMIKINEKNLIIAKDKEEISGEVLETYQVSSKLNYVSDQYIEEQDKQETNQALYKKLVGERITSKTCRPIVDERVLLSNLEETLQMAILRNYKIMEQVEKIKTQREKISQTYSTFLPRLNLELKITKDKDLELANNGTSDKAYAKLNYSWNLFNGGLDYIKSKTETLFLQEQTKTLENITNEIISDVTSQYQRFYKNKQRIELLSKYVEANVNIVEIYKNEFEAGTRTFVDILNAQGELFQSSKSLVNMQFNAMNNYYDLLYNLSILTDSILKQKNQLCDNVKPTVISIKNEIKDKDIDKELSELLDEPIEKDSTSKELSELLDDPIIDDVASKDLQDQIKEINNNLASSEIILKKKKKEKIQRKESSNLPFLKANKNTFTINIATIRGLNNAEQYIKENNLGKDAYAFEFGDNLERSKILYGIYNSVDEAKEAMKSFNTEILSNEPYVDFINKHQLLYSKYHQ